MMKRQRRKYKKKGWMVSNNAPKYEPDLAGIVEASSSRDEDDPEIVESDEGIVEIYQDDGSSSGDDEDLRYLPRRRRRDEDGSFPTPAWTSPSSASSSHASVDDGSFPRWDALVRIGPLPIMPEGSSGASCTSSDKPQPAGTKIDDLDLSSSPRGNQPDGLMTPATASPASSQTLEHRPTHLFGGRPFSMKCIKTTISMAGSLLVICIVLIAVALFRDGGESSNNKVTGTDKQADTPFLDLFAAEPTVAPFKAPTISRTTRAPAWFPTTAPSGAPSPVPTIVPTATPSKQPCEDDGQVTFDINGTPRDCAWLANSSTYQALLCNPYNFVANTICPRTCKQCEGA